MITVAAVYVSGEDAGNAIEALRAAGIADERITLLAPGTSDAEVERAVTRAETGGEGTGERVGGALGRGLGIGLGITVGGAVGSLFVPGVGAVVAAGLLAATFFGVVGARLGKAAGDEIDEAAVPRLRHDEVHIYEDALRQGRVLVLAAAEGREQVETARRALLGAGAISIDQARETWWDRLRPFEQDEYARRGGDFARDESLYRQGFEAALHPEVRGDGYSEEELRGRFGDACATEPFRRGFERGSAHRHALLEKFGSGEEPS